MAAIVDVTAGEPVFAEGGTNVGDGVGGGRVDEEADDAAPGELFFEPAEARGRFHGDGTRCARERDHEGFRGAIVGEAASLTVEIGKGEIGDKATDARFGGFEYLGSLARGGWRGGCGGGRRRRCDLG